MPGRPAGGTAPREERIVRFADEEGRVSVLRLLDPTRPDRIVWLWDGEERVLFEEARGTRTAEEATVPAAAAPCTLRVSGEVRDGPARIRFAGPCPAETPVMLRLEERDWTFHRSPDARGTGELTIPLLDPELRVVVETPGVEPVMLELRAKDPDRWLRVVMVWESAADLDLHVLEPGGRLKGRARHVWVGDPDGDGRARGRLERSDDGRRLGTKIESYMVAREALRGALLRLVAVDASRGRTTAPPHCSGGELAAPAFTVLVADGRGVRERRFRFRPVSCGVWLSDREYGLRLGRTRVR